MLKCEYCTCANPADNQTCLACGAPLPKNIPSIQKSTQTASISKKIVDTTHLENARKTGEDVEKIYRKGLLIYALGWRTLAEAAAIAIVSFAIGVTGGATHMPVWGIVCAALLGFAVGVTIKSYYLVLLSSLLGFVLGTVICIITWIIGLPPQIMVFVVTFFSIMASIFLGHPIPYKQRMFYEKIRPFLGMIGGTIFGFIGMGVGLGLRVAAMTLLGT